MIFYGVLVTPGTHVYCSTRQCAVIIKIDSAQKGVSWFFCTQYFTYVVNVTKGYAVYRVLTYLGCAKLTEGRTELMKDFSLNYLRYIRMQYAAEKERKKWKHRVYSSELCVLTPILFSLLKRPQRISSC